MPISSESSTEETVNENPPKSGMRAVSDRLPIFDATVVAPLSTTTVECYRLVRQYQIRGTRESCIELIKQNNPDGKWREYLKSKPIAGKPGVSPADYVSSTLHFFLREEGIKL